MKHAILSLALITIALASCTGPQQRAASNILIRYGERKGVLTKEDGQDARELADVLLPADKNPVPSVQPQK
ncbi:MAG TPA: hypothetical protein VD994_14755 [Prosthecobacter sp.]|nr:hypothetical protein [Prosthecobacter sp.]